MVRARGISRRLTDAQLTAIGSVTVNAVQLEFILKLWVGTLANIQSDALMALVGSMDFRPLADAVLNLAHATLLGDQRILKLLEKAVKKADSANDKRNVVVHSLWAFSRNRAALGWKVPRGRPTRFQPQLREMDARAFRAVANEIDEATWDLWTLFVEFDQGKKR